MVSLGHNELTTYICQWARSSLVQVMSRHLIWSAPSHHHNQFYCQLDPYEQTSVKFELTYNNFHSCHLTCKMATILSQPQCVNMDAWAHTNSRFQWQPYGTKNENVLVDEINKIPVIWWYVRNHGTINMGKCHPWQRTFQGLNSPFLDKDMWWQTDTQS